MHYVSYINDTFAEHYPTSLARIQPRYPSKCRDLQDLRHDLPAALSDEVEFHTPFLHAFLHLVDSAVLQSAFCNPAIEELDNLQCAMARKQTLDKFRKGAAKAGIQATAFLKDGGNKIATGSRDFAQGFSLPGEAEKAADILASFLGAYWPRSGV